MDGPVRDLVAWQKGKALCLRVYEITGRVTFPESERFGLISQMRRAAVSIPSNLAEGYGRGGAVFRNHVTISLGSLRELQTQMEISLDLGFISNEDWTSFCEISGEAGKVLWGLKTSLSRE